MSDQWQVGQVATVQDRVVGVLAARISEDQRWAMVLTIGGECVALDLRCMEVASRRRVTPPGALAHFARWWGDGQREWIEVDVHGPEFDGVGTCWVRVETSGEAGARATCAALDGALREARIVRAEDGDVTLQCQRESIALVERGSWARSVDAVLACDARSAIVRVSRGSEARIAHVDLARGSVAWLRSKPRKRASAPSAEARELDRTESLVLRASTRQDELEIVTRDEVEPAFPAYGTAAWRLVVNHDGTRAALSNGTAVLAFDLVRGAPLAEWRTNASVVEWTRDGALLVRTSERSTLTLQLVALTDDGFVERWRLPLKERDAFATLDPSQRFVVVRRSNGSIVVVDRVNDERAEVARLASTLFAGPPRFDDAGRAVVACASAALRVDLQRRTATLLHSAQRGERFAAVCGAGLVALQLDEEFDDYGARARLVRWDTTETASCAIELEGVNSEFETARDAPVIAARHGRDAFELRRIDGASLGRVRVPAEGADFDAYAVSGDGRTLAWVCNSQRIFTAKYQGDPRSFVLGDPRGAA